MQLRPPDQDELVARLDRLPTRLRVAFAAACAERQMPNYERFLPAQISEANTLKLALQRVWEAAEGKAISLREIDALLDSCMSIIDEHDLENSAPLPSDAAASVYCAISALTDDPKDALHAANRAYAAADYVVTTKLELCIIDRALAELIIAHPIGQAELHRQQLDLQDLEAAGRDDGAIASVVAKVRDRARQDADSFLGDWDPGPADLAD